MGRIRIGDIEVIPVSSTKRKTRNSIESSHRCKISRMDKTPYISDASIVPRVQKYLESNVDKTFVDINVMADDLQTTYREYSRLKKGPFRASVKKAYSVVLQSYGLEDQENSSSDDDDSDDSNADREPYQNTLNNQLANLYSRPAGSKQHIAADNEPIDISSEDDDSVAQVEPFPTKSTPNNNGTKSASNNGPEAIAVPASSQNHNSNNTNREERGKKELAHPVYANRKRKSEVLGGGGASGGGLTKKKKSLAVLQEPSVTFADLGGMDGVLAEVCKLLMHIGHPEIYRQIGISPPRGFLLHGPPGCGKTMLANAIAGEIGVPLLKVAAPELVAGVSGESEERIRELFERAVCSAPCILFIDEIDAITPNRQNAQKEMERRIVAQLLSCLDDLNQNESADRVLVIGATNRPDSIDPALRRAGRFDREICLGIPDLEARASILKVLTKRLKLSANFDFDGLAKYTPGFVGADLMSLTKEAAMAAVNRLFIELKETKRLESANAATKPSQSTADTKPEEEETSAKQGDANKSDLEIIVDDDVTKTTVSTNPSADTEEEITLVDEENKPSTMATPPLNGELNESGEVPQQQQIAVESVEKTTDDVQVEPMPVDVVKPSVAPSTLADLIQWLHDRSPMSSAELRDLCITMDDFGKALKCVQPSAKREGFATVPDTDWDDVGALADVREELQMAILAPIKHADKFKEMGLSSPSGIMLCGPPGCGKTLIAKAVANEAGINFISVKGPELLNMYVGESERAVRVCFERARNSAPCVIFFDELDAICPKRSDNREGGATMRVVNQMLTEMDGVQDRQGVYLLAASNRPDIIDPAVLRPGRFDKILFVGLPNASARVEILRAITKNGTQPRIAEDVDLQLIGFSEQCQNYTGADLAALVKEAGIIALKDYMASGNMDQPLVVNADHFSRAFRKIRPSVTEKDQKHYEKLRKLYTAVPEQNEDEQMEFS